MLLNAYGFWKLGQIAPCAAFARFILAAVMLALSGFGLLHLRWAAPEAEVLADRPVAKERVVA